MNISFSTIFNNFLNVNLHFRVIKNLKTAFKILPSKLKLQKYYFLSKFGVKSD